MEEKKYLDKLKEQQNIIYDIASLQKLIDILKEEEDRGL
jgi:hypothetical protein